MTDLIDLIQQETELKKEVLQTELKIKRANRLIRDCMIIFVILASIGTFAVTELTEIRSDIADSKIKIEYLSKHVKNSNINR